MSHETYKGALKFYDLDQQNIKLFNLKVCYTMHNMSLICNK